LDPGFDDEGIEQFEANRWDDKQVHGGDVWSMITQEGSPSLLQLGLRGPGVEAGRSALSRRTIERLGEDQEPQASCRLMWTSIWQERYGRGV
jgi:hypothetical protein